jgi:hypothetical protein
LRPFKESINYGKSVAVFGGSVSVIKTISMKIICLLLSAMICGSCNTQTEAKNKNRIECSESKLYPGVNIALTFINDYTKFCNSQKPKLNTMDWLNQNQLITDNFKKTFKNLHDKAIKDDPELGLDFDPIFDAQDFPDKGFELMSCDSKSGYVTVKGKDWPAFILVLKVVYKNNKWLVDGAGVINIPETRRAKR